MNGALLLVDPHVLLAPNVESDISRDPIVVKDATVTPEGRAFLYLITVCIRTREGATIYTVDYVHRANKDVDDFLEALDDLERTKAQPVYVICSQDSVAGMARVVASFDSGCWVRGQSQQLHGPHMSVLRVRRGCTMIPFYTVRV